MTQVCVLVLTGPFGQETSIANLDDGFPMAVCAGAALSVAIAWSENCAGLRRFLEEARRRQVDGQAKGGAGLDVAGWKSLERPSGQRSRLLVGRRISAETRALAFRCAPAQHNAEPPTPAGTHRGARRPGKPWQQDMACVAPRRRSDAGHGGGEGARIAPGSCVR